MMTDDLLEEIRAVRDAIAEEYQCDPVAMAEGLRRKREASGRPAVRFTARPPVQIVRPNLADGVELGSASSPDATVDA
jgi:hypothetical protein